MSWHLLKAALCASTASQSNVHLPTEDTREMHTRPAAEPSRHDLVVAHAAHQHQPGGKSDPFLVNTLLTHFRLGVDNPMHKSFGPCVKAYYQRRHEADSAGRHYAADVRRFRRMRPHQRVAAFREAFERGLEAPGGVLQEAFLRAVGAGA